VIADCLAWKMCGELGSGSVREVERPVPVNSIAARQKRRASGEEEW
jgi:hypothetical protein